MDDVEDIENSQFRCRITMAPKRPLEDAAEASGPKKHRPGFKIGPDNLPDGTYRRKGNTDLPAVPEAN